MSKKELIVLGYCRSHNKILSNDILNLINCFFSIDLKQLLDSKLFNQETALKLIKFNEYLTKKHSKALYEFVFFHDESEQNEIVGLYNQYQHNDNDDDDYQGYEFKKDIIPDKETLWYYYKDIIDICSNWQVHNTNVLYKTERKNFLKAEKLPIPYKVLALEINTLMLEEVDSVNQTAAFICYLFPFIETTTLNKFYFGKNYITKALNLLSEAPYEHKMKFDNQGTIYEIHKIYSRVNYFINNPKEERYNLTDINKYINNSATDVKENIIFKLYYQAIQQDNDDEEYGDEEYDNEYKQAIVQYFNFLKSLDAIKNIIIQSQDNNDCGILDSEIIDLYVDETLPMSGQYGLAIDNKDMDDCIIL